MYQRRSAGAFTNVEKPDIVAPRNLSNNLLDNYFIGPSFRKSAHIEQVRPREPFHFRKSLPQIGRQVINDLCSPANQVLSLQDVPAELLIEKNELAIYRERRFQAGLLNACLQPAKELPVSFRT
jgi:hypothetical protein